MPGELLIPGQYFLDAGAEHYRRDTLHYALGVRVVRDREYDDGVRGSGERLGIDHAEAVVAGCGHRGRRQSRRR